MNRSPSNAIFIPHNSLPLTFASAKQYGNFLLHSILSQCIFTGSNQFRPPLPWLWLFYLHFAKSYYLWSTICQVNRTDNCTQYHINIGLMMKELNIWFPSDFCSSKKQISLFKTTGKMHAEVISNLAEQICLDCWKSFPIIWSNSQALRLCIDCRLLP